MPKNILICCDGTSDEYARDSTNVRRTTHVAVRDAGQVIYYHPGVGTMAPANVRGKLRTWFRLKLDGAFAYYFEDHVADAYRYLMDQYEEGDTVYLFGFSRGAYTVRALAGLIGACGLLHKGHGHMVSYAIRYWANKQWKACGELKQHQGRKIELKFMGIWDTVGSVGLFNFNRTFPGTDKDSPVRIVRHAVAVDERRAGFRQNLMQVAPAKNGEEQRDVQNVLFPGVHCDVGGGYPAKDAALSKIAFGWMMREAHAAGMDVDHAALDALLTNPAPDPVGPMHRSLKGAWYIVELIPRRRFNWVTKRKEWRWPRIGEPRWFFKPERRPPDAAVAVHRSVYERMENCADYRPPNVPHDVKELEGCGIHVVP